MEVLAVIPARSGSIAVKDKNIRLINGKPLMAWSIESALKSKFITRILVSTDSENYKEVAQKFGAEVPFLRPNNISGGDVHSVHVVCHALNYLRNKDNYTPDLIVMLLPTSPLRESNSIDEGIAKFLYHRPPSVVSVVESSKQLIHFRYIKNNTLVPIEKKDNYNIQRQDAEKIYELNGSIYITTPETLLEHESFHLEGSMPLIMSHRESVDINTESDLELVQFFMNKNRE